MKERVDMLQEHTFGLRVEIISWISILLSVFHSMFFNGGTPPICFDKKRCAICMDFTTGGSISPSERVIDRSPYPDVSRV